MNAQDRELLSALVNHSAAPRILDVHVDDCEDVACTGCEPQHLTQVQQAADCETLRAAREASHSESDRIAYALDMVLITHPGCCTTKTPGGQA